MDVVTDISLWVLIKHLKQWLTSLTRARNERKTQSKEALRAVIIATRDTATYDWNVWNNWPGKWWPRLCVNQL